MMHLFSAKQRDRQAKFFLYFGLILSTICLFQGSPEGWLCFLTIGVVVWHACKRKARIIREHYADING